MPSALLSHFPSGLFAWVPHHFFLDPGTRSDRCPCVNLRAYSAILRAFATQYFFFLVLSSQCHCALTWRWSFLWIALVHTLIQSSSCESRREFPMLWILGNVSTRISLAPSIRSNSRYWGVSVNHSIFFFHASMASGCWCILPRHSTESQKTETFAVDSRTALSLNEVVLCHGCVYQPFRLLSDISLWSVINFCDTPINCFTVRCVIQIIFAKMNCCIQRGRHKDSPHQRIRIEVVRVVSWFATNFLSQVWVDVLKMWDRGRRYLVIVWPLWVDVDDVWTFSCRFHRTR